MTRVLLIYPYFNYWNNRSIFRFPPLGLGYVASSLRNNGYDVDILDCTFMAKEEALKKAKNSRADVVGIYCMVSMRHESIKFATELRNRCDLLVAGGPLPSSDPASFMNDFDIVVRGEGEKTMLDILRIYENGGSPESVPGILYRKNNNSWVRCSEAGEIVYTEPGKLEDDLDRIAFPARDLFPNKEYIDYGMRKTGSSTTTVFTTRGCPFRCEFCSNAVFGVSYRERSPSNVLDEVEEALSFGYGRIHFADDVFTLNKKRVFEICKEIRKRGLDFEWECLGRVDSIDKDLAVIIKEAGCDRILFGIESGNDLILKTMNKKITVEAARKAVNSAHDVGIRTGAFFILCYPGETNETVLDTIRFATSLPLDYLSFTMPYPLPGTALFERVKHKIKKDWVSSGGLISDHVLIFDAEFSETKMKFAILKGQAQFGLRKRLGKYAFFVVKPFEKLTDGIFRLIK
ncbi:MAG: B12-binding domain-containing radical SAM protein [Candidatus Methanoperedens sp.]|nr:B12-binding domain-containing radical SAM protein [Candidatus Methanoperedens sp.]